MKITFLYRSTKDIENLTVRLTTGTNRVDCKTKILVKKEFWKIKDKNFKDALNIINQRELKNDISNLELHLLSVFNRKEVTKELLRDELDKYYTKYFDSLKHWCNHIIDNSHTLPNSKGGIGLSEGRIKSYNKLITHAEGLTISKESFNTLKERLELKLYAPSYTNKLLSDFKTVCKYARRNGVKINFVIEDLKVNRIKTYEDDMDVVYLSFEEIEEIEKLEGLSKELENSRKWLILACFTGQRGTTLLQRINKDAFFKRGNKYVIRIIQKKGNKPVTIPVLKKVLEIYNEGLPEPISIDKLSKNFKKLGKLAKINTPTIGKSVSKMVVDGKEVYRKTKKERPKWRYLSSHTGRRSFATNFYGVIPIDDIKKVTGHSNTKTFLMYVNQSDDSHLDSFDGF